MNLYQLLFKISRYEGEKENWVEISHDALFLQNGRETFSTSTTFVWVLWLSSNLSSTHLSCPFLFFSQNWEK